MTRGRPSTTVLPAVESLRRFDRDAQLRLCGPLRCWSWPVSRSGSGVLLATSTEGGATSWPDVDEQLAQLLARTERHDVRPAFARVLIGRALRPTAPELDEVAELVLGGEPWLALCADALGGHPASPG